MKLSWNNSHSKYKIPNIPNFQERKANEPQVVEEKPMEVAIIHDENEWGIECIPDEEESTSSSTQPPPTTSTVQGLKFAYDAPDQHNKQDDNEDKDAKSSKPIDLSSLRAQLRGLWWGADVFYVLI